MTEPWHWPEFQVELCGTMSDRERLGLPDHYLGMRVDTLLIDAHARLQHDSPQLLLSTLKSGQCTLVERIAAGNLLALGGDPRLNVDQPDMIHIPAGATEIGLSSKAVDQVLAQYGGLGLKRAWIEKECPAHTVRLEAFNIARYPVTNFEYRVFLLDTKHAELPSSWTFRRYPLERANHPVYTVSTASAVAYAHWLATRTGRRFRLPSEAEWEWAAAGPQRREFPWGNYYNVELANTAETGLFNTSPVGAFVGGESPFGVSDMAGNVEEYVSDLYAPYPGGSVIHDHLSMQNGSYHVARGGSFARFRDLARTRRRHGHNSKSATYAMGFRLAESI